MNRIVSNLARCRLFGSGILGVLLSAAASWAEPPTYSLVELAVPGSPTIETHGLKVNDQGVVLATTYGATNNGCIWVPDQPNGSTGTWIDLSAAAPDSRFQGMGLNAIGQIAGWSGAGTVSSPSLPTLWTPDGIGSPSGTFTPLPLLPGTSKGGGWGINNVGQVVGTGNLFAPGSQPFLWTPMSPNGTNGTVVDLGDLPGGLDEGMAYDINAMGQVVGSSSTGTASHAFLWTPDVANGSTGTMVDLGVLSSPNPPNAPSEARGINDSGQVVGAASKVPFGSRPFLWTPTTPNGAAGSMLDLGALPGFSMGIGWDINNAGEIAGYSWDDSTSRGFWWSADEGLVDLTARLNATGAGWTILSAYGLNNHGQVVGWGLSPTGAVHAVLLNPASTGALGDLNGDGIVNGADLGQLLGEWGATISAADLNGDGIVDGADLGLLLGQWG